jgi:hypothetical protein
VGVRLVKARVASANAGTPARERAAFKRAIRRLCIGRMERPPFESATGRRVRRQLERLAFNPTIVSGFVRPYERSAFIPQSGCIR